jgi:hypothetical protein
MTHVRIILISVLWAFAASTAISRVEPYEDWLLRTGFTNEARASYLRALYSAGSPVSRDSLRLQVAYTFQRADEFESMMAWLERDPAVKERLLCWWGWPAFRKVYTARQSIH